jgi:hypothetical protein
MNWLLWKEYRLNRLIVFVTLFLVLLPYLIATCAICWEVIVQPSEKVVTTSGGEILTKPSERVIHWRECLFGAFLYSITLSQLSLALIGGNAIAGERVDRSAEFQAALPLTRKKILAAKLLIALAIAAAIWLFNLPAFGLDLTYILDHFYTSDPPVFEIMITSAITGLVFFCVAWLVSSVLPSPAIAACLGLITPWVVVGTVSLISLSSELTRPGLVIWIWYLALCLTIAPICFGIGTWLYLRCVEP